MLPRGSLQQDGDAIQRDAPSRSYPGSAESGQNTFGRLRTERTWAQCMDCPQDENLSPIPMTVTRAISE